MPDPTSPAPPGVPPGAPRAKRDTRQLLLAHRDAMSPADRERATAAITTRLAAALDARLVPGDVLAIYAAKGSEVGTRAIDAHARGRGLRVVYPRVVAGQRPLAFHEVEPGALIATRVGLLEPAPDAPAVELTSIRAFVIPGLAFDRAGARLGWGRGYYDATLAGVPDAHRIGVAFEAQLTDQIAHEPHDVAMHVVITEVATYTVG